MPRNTASTRPRTARNAVLGSSASRRVASSGDAPFSTRAHSRASAAVSHGPAITRPIIVTSKPGYIATPMPLPLVASAPAMNSAMPAASGASRQADDGGGVARLVTPSGEIRTRRSASSEAMRRRQRHRDQQSQVLPRWSG